MPEYAKLAEIVSAALALPSGIAVGLVVGLLLDKWLGTEPWMVFIFTLLGTVSGLLTVVREVAKLNKEDTRGGNHDGGRPG